MSSILGLVAEDTSGATGATGSSRTFSKTAATSRNSSLPCRVGHTPNFSTTTAPAVTGERRCSTTFIIRDEQQHCCPRVHELVCARWTQHIRQLHLASVRTVVAQPCCGAVADTQPSSPSDASFACNANRVSNLSTCRPICTCVLH